MLFLKVLDQETGYRSGAVGSDSRQVRSNMGAAAGRPRMWEKGQKQLPRGLRLLYRKCDEKAGDIHVPHETTESYGPIFGFSVPL